LEINPDVLAEQKQLSGKNEDFLRYVKNNPNTLKRSSFKLLELNNKLFTLQSWPTFINPGKREEFSRAGTGVWELIKSIPQRIFGNDPAKIARYYEIPHSLAAVQMEGVTQGHLDGLVARGDFILTPSGMKCLEYNVSPNLGGWQISIWESLYLNTPIIADFMKQYNIKSRNKDLLALFLEHAYNLIETRILPGAGEINAAFAIPGFVRGGADQTAVYLDGMFKKMIKEKTGSMTGHIMTCDFNNLELKDDRLYLEDRNIHVLVEFHHGLVSPAAMRAFKAGNLVLINGPVSLLLSNKLNLALLSDYDTFDVYSPAEKASIDRYIPWSRKVQPGQIRYESGAVDLLPFITANREKFVLKPGSGLGGENVFVGLKTPRDKWERAVNKARDNKNWLVQEFAPSIRGHYQSGDEGFDEQEMVWGFFVFGSRYGGAWVRVMPVKNNKGVINCHQGATVSGIFEVDE
jgi:hypothetical protein